MKAERQAYSKERKVQDNCRRRLLSASSGAVDKEEKRYTQIHDKTLKNTGRKGP